MKSNHPHTSSATRRSWSSPGERWWARSAHVLGGFWQKSVGWTIPRDERGGGYWQLAREHSAEIGFCLLFVFASGWGQTFMLSVFQPYWMRALDLNPAEMGLIYGGATLASGLLLPWAGRWLDRASPALTGTVTLLGLTCFSLLAAAVTNVAVLAVALFGLRFFGQGLSSNVGTVNAARWFHHNRGKAISLAALGFPLGEAILPMMVTLGALTLGWRETWCVLAGVCALVLIPTARLLVARHPPTAADVDDEETDERRDDDERAAKRRSILRDGRFYAMLAMMAPLPFVATGVIFFQATLAEQRGWSGAIFASGFFVYAVVRAACSISAGAWVDRLGAVRLLPVPALAAAVGLALLVRPEPVFAYLFFIAFGLGFGASGAIITAAWTEMFGTEQLGSIRAMSSSFSIFLTAAAPMCFGLAFNRAMPVEVVLFACVLLMLGLAWPASIVVRRIHRKRCRRPGNGAWLSGV